MLCMGWARSARPPFTAGTAGFARRGGGRRGTLGPRWPTQSFAIAWRSPGQTQPHAEISPTVRPAMPESRVPCSHRYHCEVTKIFYYSKCDRKKVTRCTITANAMFLCPVNIVT